MKISGQVIIGDGEGRGLGFPTANLKVNRDLNLENGVYLGKAVLDDKEYNVLVIIGVKKELEVWFDGFKGNLYDKILEVCISDKISEVKEVEDKQELINKIESDIKKARSIWQIN